MGDWRDEGICSTASDPDLWYASTIEDRTKAIEICADCPVRANCLDQALTTGEKFGVWGGVDFEEPRRAARAEYVRRGRPRRKTAPEPLAPVFDLSERYTDAEWLTIVAIERLDLEMIG